MTSLLATICLSQNQAPAKVTNHGEGSAVYRQMSTALLPFIFPGGRGKLEVYGVLTLGDHAIIYAAPAEGTQPRRQFRSTEDYVFFSRRVSGKWSRFWTMNEPHEGPDKTDAFIINLLPLKAERFPLPLMRELESLALAKTSAFGYLAYYPQGSEELKLEPLEESLLRQVPKTYRGFRVIEFRPTRMTR